MMDVAALYVLTVLIFRPGDDSAGEDGTVTARTCAEAEAFVRAGLQPGQAVLVISCEEERR